MTMTGISKTKVREKKRRRQKKTDKQGEDRTYANVKNRNSAMEKKKKSHAEKGTTRSPQKIKESHARKGRPNNNSRKGAEAFLVRACFGRVGRPKKR